VIAPGQDICYKAASSLAAAIRAKDLSPVELLRAVYERLHGVNDRINAFYTLIEAPVTSPRFALV